MSSKRFKAEAAAEDRGFRWYKSLTMRERDDFNADCVTQRLGDWHDIGLEDGAAFWRGIDNARRLDDAGVL